MKTKNIFILFALLAIVFSLAACTPTPKVSNFYMATDNQGANKTTTYTPTSEFYAFFDVKNIQAGTNFKSKWYALNIAGIIQYAVPNTGFDL